MNGWLTWDRDLFHLVNGSLHTPLLDAFFFKVTQSGDWMQIFVVLVLLVWKHARRTAAMGFAAWCTSGIACLIVKATVLRERPSWYNFAIRVDPLFNDLSFPSGHTTTTFALAVVVLLTTKGTKLAWLGYVAAIWAVLVAYSRVFLGAHYPGDVLAGAALGSLSAALTYRLFTSRGWFTASQPVEASLASPPPQPST